MADQPQLRSLRPHISGECREKHDIGDWEKRIPPRLSSPAAETIVVIPGDPTLICHPLRAGGSGSQNSRQVIFTSGVTGFQYSSHNHIPAIGVDASDPRLHRHPYDESQQPRARAGWPCANRAANCAQREAATAGDLRNDCQHANAGKGG